MKVINFRGIGLGADAQTFRVFHTSVIPANRVGNTDFTRQQILHGINITVPDAATEGFLVPTTAGCSEQHQFDFIVNTPAPVEPPPPPPPPPTPPAPVEPPPTPVNTEPLPTPPPQDPVPGEANITITWTLVETGGGSGGTLSYTTQTDTGADPNGYSFTDPIYTAPEGFTAGSVTFTGDSLSGTATTNSSISRICTVALVADLPSSTTYTIIKPTTPSNRFGINFSNFVSTSAPGTLNPTRTMNFSLSEGSGGDFASGAGLTIPNAPAGTTISNSISPGFFGRTLTATVTVTTQPGSNLTLNAQWNQAALGTQISGDSGGAVTCTATGTQTRTGTVTVVGGNATINLTAIRPPLTPAGATVQLVINNRTYTTSSNLLLSPSVEVGTLPPGTYSWTLTMTSCTPGAAYHRGSMSITP